MPRPVFAHATTGGGIHNWRRARDLTQRQLAAQVCRSRSWLSAVEIGTLTPTHADLTAIAQALGIEVIDLLPRTEVHA